MPANDNKEKLKNIIDFFSKNLKITLEKSKNYCLVLIYHRITSIEKDPQLLSVTPDNFKNQLIYLKKHFKIISLQELVESLKIKKIPKKSVVITFDDGYADNLYNALPILERLGIPATIFVTAGKIDSKREYWWDDLERIFLINNTFKPLEFNIYNKNYFFDINSKEKSDEVYWFTVDALKYIENDEREKIINFFYKWANISSYGRQTHRSMTKEELIKISKSRYIEIGAHTINHCDLAFEKNEVQKWEIIESKNILENILGLEVKSFSYPFGGKKDISDESRKFVKSSKFNCGIANIQDKVYNDTDLYLIPRRLVRNWELKEFKKKLKYFTWLINEKSILRSKSKRITLKLLTKILMKTPVINYFIKNSENSNKLHILKKEKKELSGLLAENVYNNELLPKLKKYDFIKNKIHPQQADVRFSESAVFTRRNKNLNLKNILQINSIDKKGGAGKVMYRLFENFNQKDYNCKILANDGESNSFNIEFISPDESIKQKYLKEFQENEGWLDFFHLSSFGIKDFPQFKNADIINFHNLHGDFFSLFALPELTSLKPTIWTLHDMFALTGHCSHSFDCNKWQTGCGECPDLNIYPKILKDTTNFIWKNRKAIYDNSKLTVVSPSLWLKNKVDNSILKNQKSVLIYNGIDHNIFKNTDKNLAKKQLRIPENKKVLLFCAHDGKNNRWKGGKYLTDAYEILKNRNDVLFVNLGGLSSGKSQKNWIDVPFVNDESKMSLFYNASDLFIYPTLADNCPLVVLESLSCGTPVISFKTGGVPELVKTGETGYIAEYKNADDFVKGIKIFLDNDDLRIKAGISARKSVEENFTLDIMVNKYIKLYEETIIEFYK